jgi:hypothetical protein
MIQYSYPSSGIGRKERKKYTFSNFRGVDTSVAAINVDPARAVESINFVDRDGVLHKRYGWEQVFQFDGEINGFWEIVLGGVSRSICYAGKKFYVLLSSGWTEKYTDENLVSSRTACYVNNDRAYFIGCGDFLVYRLDEETGEYNFFRVADDADTFIPTTTAQILPKNLVAEGLSGQYVRDSVNLLTKWRKNTLVSKSLSDGTTIEYQLDGKPVGDSMKISLEGVDYEMSKIDEEVISQPSVDSDVSNFRFFISPTELGTYESTELNNPLEDSQDNYPDIRYDAIEEAGAWGEYVFKINSGNKHIGLRWFREPDNAFIAKDENSKISFRTYSLKWFDHKAMLDSRVALRRFYQNAYTEEEEAGLDSCEVSIDGTAVTIKKKSEADKTWLFEVEVAVFFADNFPQRIKPMVFILQENSMELSAVLNRPIQKVEITRIKKRRTHSEKHVSKDTIQITHDINRRVLHDLVERVVVLPSGSKIVSLTDCYNKVGKFISWGFEYQSEELALACDGLGLLTVSKWGLGDSKIANVTVQYCTDTQNDIDITTCKYSTLYGTECASDRLFVANGNDLSKGNIVFFSEMNDFTYFPDNFTKAIGSNATSVEGFIRLANGSMAALKTLTANEPTVFVFQGDYIEGYYDAYETEKYILPRFSTSGVSTTQGIIAPYACANLADDSLFLSQNGVYALELSQGTDSQRFAKERSLPINNRLLECNIEELKNASAITHKNKYYLAVKHYTPTQDQFVAEGKTYYEKIGGKYVLSQNPNADEGMHRYYECEDAVYVADAHYTYTPLGAMADAPSYEWYPLSNTPVRTWFLINEELYFGTNDGRVCKFVKDNYYDIEKYYFANQPESKEAKVCSQKTVNAIVSSLENETETYDPDINDDMLIDTFAIGKDIPLFDVKNDVYDRDTIVFTSGTLIGTVWGENIDLIGKELYVEKLYEGGIFTGNIQLKYDEDGDVIQFLQAQLLVGELRRRRIVKSLRVAPTFDFGMSDYLKSMESFTITMNGVNGGSLKMDILTRNNQAKINTALGQSKYSVLNGLSKTSFNVPFQNSYTKKVAIRNFNYAIFKFYNDLPTDCSLSSLSVIYKFNRVSGGVK